MPTTKMTPAKRKKKAEDRVVATQKARDTVALGKLKPIAKEINTRFEKATALDGKAVDHRLAAAIKLDEAKKLCEKSKINFHKWVDDNVTQGWDEARKLAIVGGATDPRKAIEDMRAGSKARAQKTRDGKKEEVQRSTSTEAAPASKPPSAFQAADNAMEGLDDQVRLALATDHVAKLGMAVVSKTDAKQLTKEPSKEPSKPDLDGLKADFSCLSASLKMEFLTWAAESVGAVVDYNLGQAEATEEKDPLAIPDFLKKKATPKKSKGKRSKV